VPSDSLSIDKWRIWCNIHNVVHYLEEHSCSGVVAPVLEGVPFEVGKHVGLDLQRPRRNNASTIRPWHVANNLCNNNYLS